MIVYNMYINGKFKEKIIPYNQGIMEIHEFITSKIKEAARKYNTTDIIAYRVIESKDKNYI